MCKSKRGKTVNQLTIPVARRHRDVTIIDLDGNKSLVVACDSAGAIGPKEADVIQVPGYVIGRFTARVALMEILALGGWPVCVVNTLCVEPQPTGEDITSGVADEIRVLGIVPDSILNGSTEKNIPTVQSGLGITAIGIAKTSALRMERLQQGDVIALFGLPKVGNEVSLDHPDIADLKTVCLLLENPAVREIVPVGSRGILGEVYDLIKLYGIQIAWQEIPSELDLRKSAGPATCLLAIGDQTVLKTMADKTGKPFLILGSIFR